MASKDAPDIGLAPTNAAPYLQHIKADGLLPLDDVWKNADLSSRMDPAIAESLVRWVRRGRAGRQLRLSVGAG